MPLARRALGCGPKGTAHQYEFVVAASADDWTEGDNANTNGTTINAQYNNVTGDGDTAHYKVDTSSIAGSITSVTVKWYNEECTTGKGSTWYQYIDMGTAGGSLTEIYGAGSDYTGDTQWYTYELSGDEFSLVNTSGYTEVEFSLGNPGGPAAWTFWKIRSQDYSDTDDEFAPRLLVESLES